MAPMRPEPKKSLPGGFFLFILAAILIILGIQTFSSDQSAKVSFSHQVEHLSNLNLTVPEENRKIAQNENLVTFSGRFRENLPEESVERYRYLELLNQSHELTTEEVRLTDDLDTLQKNVRDAADLYLHATGQSLPKAGYTVVAPIYDTPDRDGAIIVTSLSDREMASLPSAKQALAIAQESGTIESVENAGKELHDLIPLLPSPSLRILN